MTIAGSRRAPEAERCGRTLTWLSCRWVRVGLRSLPPPALMRLLPSLTLPCAPRALRVLAIAATAAGAGLWGAILLAPQPADLPPALPAAPAPVSDTQALAALFGADRAIDTHVAVLGLIAAGAQGSAVLSVDGGPARAYRVGAQIAPGLMLADVSPAGIELDRNGARVSAAAPARTAAPPGIVPAP